MTNIELEEYLKETEKADKTLPGLPVGLCRFLAQELLLSRAALENVHPDLKQGTVPARRITNTPPLSYEETVPIRSPKFDPPTKPLTNRKIDKYAKEGYYGPDAKIAAEARGKKIAAKREDFDSFLANLLASNPKK